MNSENWDKEVLQSKQLVIVEFWHDKCPMCRQLDPIFGTTSENHENVKFSKLNILANNENRKLAIDYGVMGTPTLMFFCKGKSINTTVGIQQKEKLDRLVTVMIEKAKKC